MISVVIPSRNVNNVVPCVAAVRNNDPDCSIVIVDDGIDWSNADPKSNGIPCRPSDLTIVGSKPFVFSRNVNFGIKVALTCGAEGVVVLNDDALLQTPNGFSLMAQAAAEHPEYGIIAASCNNVGNPNQWNRGTRGLRDEPRMVCFVCVYIPRTTIERVGYLDERYVGYGMDDDDYCWSVRKARLKIGIHDGCVVDHKSLPSTYRGDPRNPADYMPNLKRFKEKWGFDNWGRA